VVFKTLENAQVTESSSEESVALFGDWRDEVLCDAVAEVLGSIVSASGLSAE
jgi:hypothetical protein